MLDLHFRSELRRGKGEQEERSRAILPISFAFTVEEFPCCGIKKTEQGPAEIVSWVKGLLCKLENRTLIPNPMWKAWCGGTTQMAQHC